MDAFPTAIDVAADVRAREVSPLEVLDEALARADRYDPALNALVWRDDDDARRRAVQAGEWVAAAAADELPAMIGVPVPIKDLDAVAGWPNTHGSIGAPEGAAEESDLIVLALEAAGAVLAGRTNTPEFGSITVTENQRYGITRNPWNPAHTPGGSSGGAAAVVAAGVFPIAQASDGGGSIRIPASCCGLVGLKSTRGRVPGRQRGWEGAGVRGVVSHTVADSALALDAVGGLDPLSWYGVEPPVVPFLDQLREPLERLRIAASTRAVFDLEVDRACLEGVQATLRALEGAGHEIVDVSVDLGLEELFTHFSTITDAGLSGYDDVDWARVEPHNREGHARARAKDSLVYTSAVRALEAWSRRVNAQWGDSFDVLVTPTIAIEPPPAGEVLAALEARPEKHSMTVLRMVTFTAPFNMNGLPAITVPAHQAPSGLPVGVQLVAGPRRDGLALRLAAQLEQARPWAGRHPDLGALADIG